ncbi:SDR family NAD(P)-dependent oxidoreductase [Chitinophaga sancti]|uniref:NADP-dependent 3-hydroxy acid dehydrogenase YdfG n=1 Tax=Chitinophaga sancti TaxID=1004 RepID=A0A1K1RF49_9BACT|nr:SDR family NAD(P)-dependent oxidoreductase [Chitinophaga sancti]WQD65721.1 SDR family NAD(P)-dependent oxidoreductase [Chitinophaga sancti]WQG88657.1 SDR family NAD(P)-dependent oxidoreductase [Chitinophaga sancti]SFW70577.1 NADP-dependent 3-hydroxy acid dehydrogenase YdfG [Chitinophaga sancti]
MGIVLITGATAGFGEACARKFAAKGYDLIITGRRQERLTALQQDLEKTNGVKVLPLTFDVQDEKAVSSALEQIPDSWKAVDVLINNAGLALGLSTIDEGSLSDWDTMIDTNVKGLLYVSRVVIPWLKARKKGHIINLGSTAAKTVYAKGNVYCATKAAVDAISQGMRIDLLPYFIKVTAIHPGAAETEFSVVRFKGDAGKADDVYKGFKPLSADDVADTIYYCATLPAHVCINDLVITCTQQANAIYTYKE